MVCTTRRVARIWKRGGYFERVKTVQTALTRIFIVLESVSHGLSKNWDEISRKARKFKGIFRPKTGGLHKKKKGLHRNWDWFFGPNRKFKRFKGAVFNFSQKSASKPPKTCDFAYFTSQWRGLEPPRLPPWLRYCVLRFFTLAWSLVSGLVFAYSNLLC